MKAYLKGFSINLHFLLHLLCTIVLMILPPSQIKHFQLSELQSHFMSKYPLTFHVKPWWECSGLVLWAKGSGNLCGNVNWGLSLNTSYLVVFKVLMQPTRHRANWKKIKVFIHLLLSNCSHLYILAKYFVLVSRKMFRGWQYSDYADIATPSGIGDLWSQGENVLYSFTFISNCVFSDQ